MRTRPRFFAGRGRQSRARTLMLLPLHRSLQNFPSSSRPPVVSDPSKPLRTFPSLPPQRARRNFRLCACPRLKSPSRPYASTVRPHAGEGGEPPTHPREYILARPRQGWWESEFELVESGSRARWRAISRRTSGACRPSTRRTRR